MKPFSHFTRTSFFGRPYRELLQCFGFEECELLGKQVLECPSGPSSFVVEANAAGIVATGVDPMFYRSPDAIRRLAHADFQDMYQKIESKPEFIVAKTYQSIEESKRIRFAALERFLEDYQTMYPHDRYVNAELPKLPYFDKRFDISLCGHLLFIYPDLFDLEFSEKALIELCRVSQSEVRVHPIVDNTGSRYRQLNYLRERIEAQGHSTEIIEVDHEFFRGTNETLRIVVSGR